MNLNEWNKTEIRVIIDEALGKDNRYFFWKKHGREAYNNDELIIYYILNGGAEKFAREHSNEKPDATDK